MELPFVGTTLGTMLNSMGMNFVLGYSGYYIWGYYLWKYPLSDKPEKALYICGGVLLLLGAGANTWQSIRDDIYNEWYTTYTAPNTIIIATALYTLFTKRIRKVNFRKITVVWISKLTEYSFGIYLVHALILDIFAALGLKPTILHPLVSMPLITFFTFVITTIIVILIRTTPYFGRKIT